MRLPPPRGTSGRSTPSAATARISSRSPHGYLRHQQHQHELRARAPTESRSSTMGPRVTSTTTRSSTSPAPRTPPVAMGMRLGGGATHYVKNNYVGQLSCVTCTYTPKAFKQGETATINADNNVSFDDSADDFTGANNVITRPRTRATSPTCRPEARTSTSSWTRRALGSLWRGPRWRPEPPRDHRYRWPGPRQRSA